MVLITCQAFLEYDICCAGSLLRKKLSKTIVEDYEVCHVAGFVHRLRKHANR